MSTADLSIRTIATPGLGDRSYVVIADGHAVAVDVQRDIDRVEQVLRDERAALDAVLETHLHNDYLTGGLALARRHGAEYVVPSGPPLGYSATRAVDGMRIGVGPFAVRAIATPGHTDAHAAYSVHRDDEPAVAAFTGGSLLHGAVGRTDLLGIDRAEALARQQYWSVRRLARVLAPETQLLPTHGFGSFCAAGPAKDSGDTVAAQLTANPAYLQDEEEFVHELLARCGPYPRYYAFMGPRNTGGVTTADVPTVQTLDLDLVLDRPDSGGVVLDVRPRGVWARAHLRGSLAIDAAGAVATWFGWLRPVDAAVSLVAPTRDVADAVVRELHRIGVDHIVGAHVGSSFSAVGGDRVAATERRDFTALAAALVAGESPLIIDVRESSDWQHGHVSGALHIPVHEIESTFDGALPRVAPWFYCGVGIRAAISASLLERMGGAGIVVDDSVDLAATHGVPWCTGASCADFMCTADLRATRLTEPSSLRG